MVAKKFAKIVLLILMAVMLLALVVPVLAKTSTTVSIGNAIVKPGETTILPLTIETDATIISGIIRLEYTAAVVKVNSVIGDGLNSNISNPGLVTMAFVYAQGKTGTITLANVALEAVGNHGDSSPLTIVITELYRDLINPTPIVDAVTNSGTFTIEPIRYTLTVTSSPETAGTVGLNPAQPTDGYIAGTVVTLTATASTGYDFANWSGDLSVNTNPATIIMNTNKDVTANFQRARLYGDINNDGVVNSVDALKIAQHLVEIITLTGNDLLAADVNHSGAVTSIDLLLVKQYLVGIIDAFPGGLYIP